MPHDESKFLGPAYPAALRVLVDRALGKPRPVPRDAPPGGPIHERISAPGHGDAGLVVSNGVEAEGADAEEVSPGEYWTRALAHRWLCIGPWADLSGHEERMAELESQLLTVYREQYQCAPLPHDLLALVRLHHGRRPDDELPEWLESIRESLLSAPTAGEAMRRRAAHRAAAMLCCVEGTCSEVGAAVVELFSDIFALSLAAKHDLERALERAGREGKSTAAIVKEMSDSGETTVEMILPQLRHSGVRLEDFPSNRHEAVLAFVRSRQPVAWERFLDSSSGVTSASQSEAVPTTRVIRGPDRPHEPAADDAIADPVQAYRDLRSRLEDRILGRPDLCRRLALVGLGHLLGVAHQRILLCGGTGSGKTHSATVLAEALDRPLMRIDVSDATATGWKGLDIPDVLDILATRGRSTLEGSVLVLDEVDKVRIEPGTDGNSLQAQAQLQASLLALLDGALVTSDRAGGLQLDTARLLVIGTGAFAGKFTSRVPATDDLIQWGWIPELAARWGERICLVPPSRDEGLALLLSSERSVRSRLAPLTSALGVEIEVPPAVLGYVVDRWFRSGADYRSAAEWLLAAARGRLLNVLEKGGGKTITLAPDDIDALAGEHSRDEQR